jgi:hypothetical protein
MPADAEASTGLVIATCFGAVGSFEHPHNAGTSSAGSSVKRMVLGLIAASFSARPLSSTRRWDRPSQNRRDRGRRRAGNAGMLLPHSPPVQRVFRARMPGAHDLSGIPHSFRAQTQCRDASAGHAADRVEARRGAPGASPGGRSSFPADGRHRERAYKRMDLPSHLQGRSRGHGTSRCSRWPTSCRISRPTSSPKLAESFQSAADWPAWRRS